MRINLMARLLSGGKFMENLIKQINVFGYLDFNQNIHLLIFASSEFNLFLCVSIIFCK